MGITSSATVQRIRQRQRLYSLAVMVMDDHKGERQAVGYDNLKQGRYDYMPCLFLLRLSACYSAVLAAAGLFILHGCRRIGAAW